MRLSEVSWTESELPAGSSPARDPGGLITAQANHSDLADRPGPRWPSRDEPDGSRGLADRLACLPDAHPSAWSAAVEAPAARSSADWAGARTSGDPAGEDAWWRGETGAWWHTPDESAGEPDSDDIGAPDDPREFADADDVTDAARPGETDGADADGAGEAGITGEAGGHGAGGGRSARASRRTRAGRDHDRRGEAGAPRGPGHEPYQPWFSPQVSGDPWFAAAGQYG